MSFPRVSPRTLIPIAAAAILLGGMPNGLESSAAQSWLNSFDGEWDEPLNWNPATVPDSPTADVVLGGLFDPVTVTLVETRTVNSILFENNVFPFRLVTRDRGSSIQLAGVAEISVTDALDHGIALPISGTRGLLKTGAGAVLLQAALNETEMEYPESIAGTFLDPFWVRWIMCHAEQKHTLEMLHAEAHSLPYAHDFFDAIVCVDSYNYYGTDDLYLNTFQKFVKRGGQIGIVVPALMRPDHRNDNLRY